jgi:hypothetical protein
MYYEFKHSGSNSNGGIHWPDYDGWVRTLSVARLERLLGVIVGDRK